MVFDFFAKNVFTLLGSKKDFSDKVTNISSDEINLIGNKPVVVMFNSPMTPNTDMYNGIFNKIDKKTLSLIDLFHVNVDVNIEIVRWLNVTTLPVTIFINRKNELDSSVGMDESEINSKIRSLIK